MAHSIAAKDASTERNATVAELRSLETLMDRYRRFGVTVAGVAERAGVSSGYVSQVRRGIRPLSGVPHPTFLKIKEAIVALAREGRESIS